MNARLLLSASLLLCLPAVAAAEDDPNIAIQGEYTGELETNDGPCKFGVQVIALGEGKFQAVAYHGGLPGDGWNQQDKHSTDGQSENGVTVFKSDKATGTIKDGTLTIVAADGNAVGKLNRVERRSPTLGAKPPQGAMVLFDGTSADNFEKAKLEEGLLILPATSKQKFQSCTLHLEFRTPFMPQARGQARGNSGCYLQGRYEVQILDSFGLEGKNNECGGIYEIRDPDVNMCFPPMSWQTYDIDYTAAKYDDQGKKTESARITVRHNGVVVHDNVALPRATRASPVAEGVESGPIYLQDHGNPVRFRNIWLVER